MYVLAIMFKVRIILIDTLNDRSSMFKAVAEEWDLNPWQEFTWYPGNKCDEDFELIPAIDEIAGVSIYSKMILEDKDTRFCGRRAFVSMSSTIRT